MFRDTDRRTRDQTPTVFSVGSDVCSASSNTIEICKINIYKLHRKRAQKKTFKLIDGNNTRFRVFRAGSLGTSVFDSNVYLVGASGGVYALLAAHLANVMLVRNA